MKDHASTAPTSHFAMSVDVEDYFQVWAFADVIRKQDWDMMEQRADRSTRACLDLFDAHGVKATFFTLGWLAEREPALVREIAARGHELASHGYDHRKAFTQTRNSFSQDVKITKAILEDIAGVSVDGFRAAGFSIDAKQTPWAYEALREAGYRYSSSLHPISHDHYGDPRAPVSAYRPIAGDDFLELPVATANILGRRLSCAGGGWFRITPFALSRSLLARAARANAGPIIFYFHPWELDPDQPRIRAASLKSKIRHYAGLGAMEDKLSRLLALYDWGAVGAAARRVRL